MLNTVDIVNIIIANWWVFINIIQWQTVNDTISYTVYFNSVKVTMLERFHHLNLSRQVAHLHHRKKNAKRHRHQMWAKIKMQFHFIQNI